MGWSGDGRTVSMAMSHEGRGTATVITVEVVSPELNLEMTLPVTVQVSEHATTHKLVAAALADMAAAVSTGCLMDFDQISDPFARLERFRCLQDRQGTGVKKIPVQMLCPNCNNGSPPYPVKSSRLAATDRRGIAVATQTEMFAETAVADYTADEEASCRSDENAFDGDSKSRYIRRTASSTAAAQLSRCVEKPRHLSLHCPTSPSLNALWMVPTGMNSQSSFCFGSASPVSNDTIGSNSPTRGRQLTTPTGGGAKLSKTTPTSDDRCTIGEDSRDTSSRATTTGSAPTAIDSVGVSSLSDSSSGSEMECATEITISGSCRPDSRQAVAVDHVSDTNKHRRRRIPSKRISSSNPPDITPLDSSLLSALDNAIVDRIANQRAVATSEVISGSTCGQASPCSSMPFLDPSSPLHKSESACLPSKVAATLAAIDARGDGKERMSCSLDSVVRRQSLRQVAAEVTGTLLSTNSCSSSTGSTGRRICDRRDSNKKNSTNSARSGGSDPASPNILQRGGRSSELPPAVLMQQTFSPDFPETLPHRLMPPKRRNSIAGSSTVSSHAIGWTSSDNCPSRPSHDRSERDRGDVVGLNNYSLASTGMPPRLPWTALSTSLATTPSPFTDVVQAMQARRRHSVA